MSVSDIIRSQNHKNWLERNLRRAIRNPELIHRPSFEKKYIAILEDLLRIGTNFDYQFYKAGLIGLKYNPRRSDGLTCEDYP